MRNALKREIVASFIDKINIFLTNNLLDGQPKVLYEKNCDDETSGWRKYQVRPTDEYSVEISKSSDGKLIGILNLVIEIYQSDCHENREQAKSALQSYVRNEHYKHVFFYERGSWVYKYLEKSI